MEVTVSRASVSAGDDVDAPHGRRFTVADQTKLDELLSQIVGSGYLPAIHGGKSTWSVAASQPLAAVVQEWSRPKLLPMAQIGEAKLSNRLHFNYHAQIEPDVVYEVLLRLHLGTK